jgi:phosphate starvation-inducible PhoH-like protein
LRKRWFLNIIAYSRNRKKKDNYKENILSKRKTGSLARSKEDTRYSHKKLNQSNTFYMNESKTIDFTQVQQPKYKSKKVAELLPRSLNQEKYILSLLDEDVDIVVVSGPAGTGKTYLAMVAAIKALRENKCDRIILTRPAVGVDDEKHGFLPGDINQKMEPWTRPLLDVLREYYSVREITHMLEEQIVEIAPLAFCRGRNFKESMVILDEAQNATPSQMKMIMTRIGIGSKIIICGDTDQTDRKITDNGLLDLQHRLQKISTPRIQSCMFDLKDIQRHHLIGDILKMYE